MTLPLGTRLGPYEIVAPIGAGGMGEVYRAKDTKLNREVAIKVLPESFALDADRVARFTREAQVLASLNHPNIAAVYGIEESGSTRALVMELVDGEDLSAHIARGPIALSEALPIARQIADALEAAHEQGIVHRDLKPQNIKVRADGTVKVLDFGLAKAMDPDASGASAMNSPTMTARATQMGMIIGTAAYMAPEQARGRAVDRRADIWAFSVVLYEMLTGRRAFEGEDISVTLANVIKEDPNWDALPKDLPSPMLRLLRRCLEKDPRRRLSAIADARLELDEAGAPSDGASPGAARAGISRRERWVWASVAGLAAVTALAFALRSAPARDVAAPVIRFGLEVGETAEVPRMAISPDGQSLVFLGTRPDGGSSLLVRRLDSIDSTPVAASEDALNPFWSPDSRQVAFFSGKDQTSEGLWITDLQGGGARTIVNLPTLLDAAGSWNADGLVLVASRGTKGIQRISLNGGQLTPVTTLDPSGGEIAHLYPQFLPDGRHFIYQAETSARENWAIFIGSIDAPVRRKLVQSDYAQFAAPNLLVYTQRENLVAQTLDLSTLALTGQPAVIATSIALLGTNGRAAFSVSDTGVLVYKSRSEGQGPIERHLTWLDRSGKVLNVVGPPVTSSVVRLSPDDTRVALLEVPASLWVADLARDVKAPVLRTQAASPTWSADGARLLFGVKTNTFDNQSALFERDAAGATPMKTLPAGKGFSQLLPFDETSDGTLVLFGRQLGGSGRRGIGMLSTADGKVTTYLDNDFTGSQAALSPDRRFLAYTSTETNASQVIVQAFPDPSGGKWIVSVRGGSAPRWRRDGRELFYVDAEQHLVSVPVTAGSSFVPGRATPLFSLPVSIETDSSGAYGYDAAADGQRFLVSLPPEGASVKAPAIPLTVITNWTMLLKKGAR